MPTDPKHDATALLLVAVWLALFALLFGWTDAHLQRIVDSLLPAFAPQELRQRLLDRASPWTGLLRTACWTALTIGITTLVGSAVFVSVRARKLDHGVTAK